MRRIDGGVFPAFPAGGRAAGDEGGGAEAGFADVPDACGFVGGVDAAMAGCAGRLPRRRKDAGFGIGFGLGAAPNSTMRKPSPGGRSLRSSSGFLLAAQGVEEIAVDAFEADGFVFEDLGNVVGGEEDVGKAERRRECGRGDLDELESGAEDDGAGAFAADEGAGDVEAVFGQELVEVVAGDAAGDAGKLCAD